MGGGRRVARMEGVVPTATLARGPGRAPLLPQVEVLTALGGASRRHLRPWGARVLPARGSATCENPTPGANCAARPGLLWPRSGVPRKGVLRAFPPAARGGADTHPSPCPREGEAGRGPVSTPQLTGAPASPRLPGFGEPPTNVPAPRPSLDPPSSQLVAAAPFLPCPEPTRRAVPVTGTRDHGEGPGGGGRGQTGAPGEERAAVPLTHPEDEVKAEEQVLDALGASFDRHGEGCTGLGCTGLGRGARPERAGPGPGRRAGGCGLASGLHF